MRNIHRKLITLLAPAMAGLLLFTSVASAHITVAPAQSHTAAWETYTLKVPSEKDAATVQIDLRIPEGAEFKQYEPVPGWEVAIEGNKVSWKAVGKGIEQGQFQRFFFTAKNPDTAGDIAWNAYQHYADGSLVQWSGEAGSETPHSITTISKSAASDGAHDHGSMVMEDQASTASTSPLVYVTLGIAVLALLLAFIALFRGRRT